MNSNTMTYTQAKMIISNPYSGYTRDQIRFAALWMLGCLRAKQEDVMQAANLL
jgi:hypothetical protein